MGKAGTDYQRQRVYDWENKVVAPLDRQRVPYANIQAVVDYIWAAERLQYPPQVEPMSSNMKKALADATRITLRFRDDGAPTWVIIHELAHSMTSTADQGGDSVAHGPTFVGVYMRLLEKYLGANLLVLMGTAKTAKVDFDIMASPIFLD